MTNNNILPEIKIKTNEHTYDCDCCGFYSDLEVNITFPCGNQLCMISDGHFGNGDWSGQPMDMYALIFNYFGVKFKTDGIEHISFYDDELTKYFESFRPKVDTFDEVDFTTEDKILEDDRWMFIGYIDSLVFDPEQYICMDNHENGEFDSSYESLMRIYLKKICNLV